MQRCPRMLAELGALGVLTVVTVGGLAPPQKSAPPAIPTVTLPCISDTTELLADESGNPVLCWGAHCIAKSWDGFRSRDEVPRPPMPSMPATQDGYAERDVVCAGGTCEQVGPALRVALAVHGRAASATSDRAAVVIDHEVWSRAADRRITLPRPANGETLDSVDVLGDRVLVSHACMEYCSDTGTLIDARGRVQGKTIATDPRWKQIGIPSMVDLGGGRFAVFGKYGPVGLVEGGRVVASESIADKKGSVIEATVAIDHEHLAYLSCDGTTCAVGRLRIHGDIGNIVLEHDDDVVPQCAP